VNVLLLVHGLPVGGTEKLVVDLARHLAGKGTGVFIGCLDTLGSLGEELREEGIPLQVYGRRPGFDFSLPWKIGSSVKKWRIDMVHAHQYTCFCYGVLSKILTRRPLIFTEHGRFYPDVVSARRRAFNRVFSRLCDRVTAVSEGVRQSLVEIDHFGPSAIEVIYNGIDPARFQTCSREEARQDLGVTARARVVGTVGRLDPIKNQALLIRAFARVKRELSEALLVVVGEGPEGNRLRDLTANLGLDGSVRFLGERRDIERILPAFDVFALSSFSEGTPLTILEAMAAATAIVSTGVGGIPELCGPGEAILVPPVRGCPGSLANETPEAALANGLRAVLLDTALAESLARNARARLLREFTLDSICSKYLEIYRLLAPSHG
jgi:glycosyltransferase involved in cell wall biosynthesis